MGKKKGNWRKFFCCAGPPETQSSTCVNISESEHTVPPSVPELEQEDEDACVEAEVQTSNMEIPEGNRWRWSRLHNEVEVQTSFASLPLDEVDTSSETDAQVQTSFSSIPRQIEAQAQTSFLSLRSPSPFEADAQVQTSFVELPREIEAQVQTSLLSLPEEKEAQVQTSFLSLPRGGSAGSLRGSIQGSPSYLELLEKIAPYPPFTDSQVQTSDFSIPLSQSDIQVQTSFSDFSEKEDASSIQTERERSSSQLSDVDNLYMYPLYTDAEVQTLPVEIPPGNDWRSTRLKAAAQVQTSIASVKKESVPRLQNIIQVQPAKLEMAKAEEIARILEAARAAKDISPPSDLTETGIQTSDIQIQEWDKWCSPRQQVNAQVQTSTIELLKKLSLLSQIAKIESMDPVSRAELLKKMSWADAQVQTSSPELMRKASALSESGVEDRVLSTDVLKKRPSSAQVSTWSYELAQMLSSPPRAKEPEMQTADLELKKRLSSLSLTKVNEENKEEITEGKEYLITPQDIEHQIRKWYEELPEVQTSDSQAAVQKQLPWSSLVDSEVQTSYVEIPLGNKWRASRMQAEAEVQTEGYELSTDEAESSSPQGDTQTQTSLLDVWKARDLAEAQIQTSISDVDQKEESSPVPVVDTQIQTSLLDIWKAKEQADFQTQTVTEHSVPAEQSDRLVQTSFMDIWKAKELENMRQKTAESESEVEASPPLYSDLEGQTSLTDVWRGKEKTGTQPLPPSQMDAQVQTSSSKADMQVQTSIPNLEEGNLQPPLASQLDTQAQTSLLDIWKAKELSETQTQTSWMDLPKSEKEPPVLPPSHIDTQVQTSLLDMWKTKELADVQMQTPWTDSPKLGEESPTSPPSHKDIQAQTSLLDVWRTKELSDVQMQTPWTDFPKLGGDPLATSPSQKDIQAQGSLLDMWKTKEMSEIQIQTPWTESQKLMEEPPVPIPSHKDTQAQTSLINIWKAKELSDAQNQTTWTDGSESVEGPPAPLPSSHKDTQVQTSLSDIWKTKELSDVQNQTSWTNLSKPVEEPPVSPQLHKDTQVQTSIPDIWKAKELSDVQNQTPWTDMTCSMEDLSIQPRVDTQVQTSLTDIWRTKELTNAQMQTYWPDLQKSMQAPPIPPQPESSIQPPTSVSESLLPTQINIGVQTSSPDIWKKKELTDAKIQTSLMDMPQTTEAVPFPPQMGLEQLSATKVLEQLSATKVLEQLSATSLAAPPAPLPLAQIGPEKQASLSDMSKDFVKGKEMSKDLVKGKEMSKDFVKGKEMSKEHAEDVQKQSSEFPKSGTEPPPPSPDLEVQSSQLDIPKKVPDAKTQFSSTELPSATVEPFVLSQTASPVQLLTSQKVDSASLPQDHAQLQMSLLKQWTTREEAELQKQTDNLGLSFGDDLTLFPLLEESRMSEEKLEQISKRETKSKTPLFTEAQVQTSYVEIPRGKKWRASRLCTEAQVQTSFHDIHVKDRVPGLQKMVADHVAAKRVPKGPKRAAPVSVHLHVKMSPKRRTSNEKK